MKVVITGGCGFIATSLAKHLLSLGQLTPSNSSSPEAITQLVLFDSFVPDASSPNDFLADLRKDPRIHLEAGDIRDKSVVDRVINVEGDTKSLSVFHLASILSGQGETDFDLCLQVNLDGTRNIIDALKSLGKKVGSPQKIVFSSTNAIFGPTETITDDSAILPQTTYGATKAMCEKLISDYTRKGFLLGCGCRLPSVLIRPVPNTAASNCFNAIMREPLRQIDYVLPVPFSTTHPITGKTNVIKCLVKLHEMCNSYEDELGIDRFVVLPARSFTMQEMLNAAKRLGDKEGIKLGNVTEKVDPAVLDIVKNWPPFVDYKRAKALHFPDEIDIDEIVADFVNTYIKK